MIVQPKFNVGDVVFYPSFTTERRVETCPDCLDTGLWEVKTPAGEEFQLQCATCCPYIGRPALTNTVYVPIVRALTIGQIGLESDGTVMHYRYMCRETGIGSGSVYQEENLCETREQADSLARFRANEAQADYDKRVLMSRNEKKRRPQRKPKRA